MRNILLQVKAKFPVLATLALGMALTGCAMNQTEAVAPQLTLQTKVMYLQRMALPPQAEVTVELATVASDNTASRVISQQTQAATGMQPYQVALTFDATKVEPVADYVLRAKIAVNGEVIMRSVADVAAFANPSTAPTEIMVAPVPADIANIQWKLTTLGGNAVPVADNKQALYLELIGGDNRVTGFAGCNRFAGSYTLQQAHISFEQLLSTRKMCFQHMGLEQMFLAALAETDSYDNQDNSLVLLNAQGEVIAEFVAQDKE